MNFSFSDLWIAGEGENRAFSMSPTLAPDES
jgi:hypothetical protein